jgi:Kef-type K+ transport system membrane component KefB
MASVSSNNYRRLLHLLTFAGGLHTSFQSLKANLLLSSGVALTGIAVPIGLSYTLQGLLNATPVQSFAAGAALCSTSLGTTFTVLGSSGLSTSRLGVVLTSAAMMDDVVGLVMVQVISNLGGDNFSWITVVRPVLVSVAFGVLAPLVCLLVVKPLTLWLNKYRAANSTAVMNKIFARRSAVFIIHTLILIGLVTGATYAGTSNLFAAYIAGATISWWDSEVPHPATGSKEAVRKEPSIRTAGDQQPLPSSQTGDSKTTRDTPTDKEGEPVAPTHPSTGDGHANELCGSAIYEHYYHPSVSKILQPFFFASVGFSIPITRMFKGSIVWRGIVYTVLMAFSKFVCGFWLVRFTTSSTSSKNTVGRMLSKVKAPSVPHLWGKSKPSSTISQAGASDARPTPTNPPSTATDHCSSAKPAKPFSLHPPLILALAMCARGEIGFLISGVAEANGIFSASGETSSEPSDIFLVVTWAIVLCTIIGPLGVGLSVRRVKKLQERKEKQQEGAGRDVLGVWGMGVE